MIVKRAARRLVGETDDVIDIWRRNVSERQIKAGADADRIECAIEEYRPLNGRLRKLTVLAVRAPASNAMAINPNTALTPFEKRSMQKTGRIDRVARELT